MIAVILLLLLPAISAYAQAEGDKENFSVMPQRIKSISAQKNSEWEELFIVFDSQLAEGSVPALTDSTVELSVSGSPNFSDMFPLKSDIANGVAWTNNKFVVYLKPDKKIAVMLLKDRMLLQCETSRGKLENWQVRPTELKSSNYYLPSYEALAFNSADFAKNFSKKRKPEKPEKVDMSISQAIQVKRADASYIVTEDIASLFPNPSEGKPLEALEFGDRLKVLARKEPYYKVRYRTKEGYVRQRDVRQEVELTTAERDRLLHLKKDSPGGADSVAAKFGWKDSDKIIYSSYGFRDPFVEVKSFGNDSLNLDNLVLVGVIFEDEKPMAILSNNKIKGKSHTLYEGDTVKHGKILKISKNSVLFLLQEYGVSRRYEMVLPDKYGGEK